MSLSNISIFSTFPPTPPLASILPHPPWASPFLFFPSSNSFCNPPSPLSPLASTAIPRRPTSSPFRMWPINSSPLHSSVTQIYTSSPTAHSSTPAPTFLASPAELAQATIFSPGSQACSKSSRRIYRARCRRSWKGCGSFRTRRRRRKYSRQAKRTSRVAWKEGLFWRNWRGGGSWWSSTCEESAGWEGGWA